MTKRQFTCASPRTSGPSQELLQTRLRYDPVDGALYWINCGRRDRIGKRAGKLHRNGYRYLTVFNREYREHRLIWALHYDEWPELQIDHINGRPDDNRIENLRLATPTLNQVNKGAAKNSSTGMRGVKPSGYGGFCAVITLAGKSTYLGTFETAEEASAAYRAASIGQYGAYAHQQQSV